MQLSRYLLRRLRHLLFRIAGRRSPEELIADLKASGQLSMGRHTYGAPAIPSFANAGRVWIGSFCSIAKGVTIMTGGNHRTDWVTTFPLATILGLEPSIEAGHPATRGDVHIGDDVWVGRGTPILSGVHIGTGAVVAARAVVSRDVEPYTIVAGNPAKAIRTRFSDEQITALLEIRWWDWPDSHIHEAASRLCSSDIDDFIEWARYRQAVC